jgi:hypothetical protein
MNEVDQLANAMLVFAFATVLMVLGHFYLENRAQRSPTVPAAQMVMMKTSPL